MIFVIISIEHIVFLVHFDRVSQTTVSVSVSVSIELYGEIKQKSLTKCNQCEYKSLGLVYFTDDFTMP